MKNPRTLKEFAALPEVNLFDLIHLTISDDDVAAGTVTVDLLEFGYTGQNRFRTLSAGAFKSGQNISFPVQRILRSVHCGENDVYVAVIDGVQFHMVAVSDGVLARVRS